MFDQFPSQSRAHRSLLVSVAIHSAIITAVLATGFAVQSIVAPSRTASVQWIAPIPTPIHLNKPRTIRPPKPAPRIVATLSPIKLTAPPPEPTPIVLEPPRPIPATVAKEGSQAPVQKEVRAVAAPPKIQLGGFSTASTAALDQPVSKLPVATISFGDAGIATASASRRSVSTSGFGDAAITSSSAAPHGQVRSSGFGDAVSATPSAIAARPPSPPPATAAQILAKPRPAYTEEARRLEIEGEVELEVVFGASGEVHILRVVRGLGHGLDENAVIAAKAIRFLPAKKNGHTVDSTATVHIIFQLAS